MFRERNIHFRRHVKAFLESTFGARIYVGAHGHDECADIKAAYGMTPVKCVFDVGANVGQSARKFIKAFPRATIYCFEPVVDCFNRLTASFAGNGQVQCHQMALGRANGKGTLYLTKHEMRCSLIRPEDAIGTQPVAMCKRSTRSVRDIR